MTQTMTQTEYMNTDPSMAKTDPAYIDNGYTHVIKNHHMDAPPHYQDLDMKSPNGKTIDYKNYDGDDSESYTDSSQVSSETSAAPVGAVSEFQHFVKAWFVSYGQYITKAILLLMLAGYTVYFAFAIRHSVDGAKALIILTGIALFFAAYVWVRDHWGHIIWRRVLRPTQLLIIRTWPCTRWLIIPGLMIGAICYIAFGVVEEIRQLQSISGIIVFVSYLYITSKYPEHIVWQPVIVGFGLQFLFSILVLRWKPGYDAIQWFSDEIMKFINYALEGAATVFGNPTMVLHPFVFVIMPMLIYIGAVMSILFYLGITQVISAKMGWFMQILMKTTAIESLAIASNIFLNGMDTMLMLRQYLPKLTASEFHCFLVGNHATVAGFAFATFVMFGAPPQYLISASVMSAPATLAVAKLNYPETEESVTKTQADVKLESGEESNAIEAGANGAAVAGKTVTAVVVNYIGFLGLLAFINATLSWIGNNVGFPELSFEVICSYLFWPLSLLMGVEWSECRTVAKLVGIKVFTSEMLAYQELGVEIANGLSGRSASIATYALCGFSSLSTLAIAVGVWNTVCPQKTKQMTGMLGRVITNANISCFLTACIAGLMHDRSLEESEEDSSLALLLNALLGILPDYKALVGLVF